MTKEKFKKSKKDRFKKEKNKLSADNRKGITYNDISWYRKNPEITKNFCNVPFSYVVGSNLELSDGGGNFNVPLLFVYGVDWCAGISRKNRPNDSTDFNRASILNQVATILYTLDRRANSGATNYDFPDVFISNVIGAIDVFCQIANITRTLNLVNSYTWKNRTMPRVIIETGLNIDYGDLVRNLNSYVGRFNTLMAAANTIKLPNQFDFVKAAMAQYTQVFKDADSQTGREQIYLGVKYFNHIYDPVGTEDHPGGTIRFIKVGDVFDSSVVDKPEDLEATLFMGKVGNKLDTNERYVINKRKLSVDLDILEKSIYALITDSDFNTIQGDLEKAFGDGGSFVVSDVLKDIGSVEPEYSGEFRAAFENARFLPIPITNIDIATSGKGHILAGIAGATRHEIRQTYTDPSNPGAGSYISVYYHQAVDSSFMTTESLKSFERPQTLLSSTSDQPSEDDIIYMTRYSNTFRKVPSAELDRPIQATGYTHYYFSPNVSSNFIVYEGYVVTLYNYNAEDSLADPDTAYGIVPWYQFAFPNYRYLPAILHMFEFMIQLWNKFSSGTNRPVDMRLDNPKLLSENELHGIQEACMLSLWNLPFNRSF